ncbi:Rab1a [Hexamita inflata]|uniref:Rab1a n=1 Tax=Hexamita inflata TaxID=28002 RepID=A0AA86PQZ0_9EUKA|nr:Rab1a [Hexamita inflata]CAI9939905.1 Rab1a [Hexamita inflata]CAI9963902.1 Rab1a [Hexamita inflata]
MKHQFKLVIVGDSAVGKTSLLEYFVNEKFSALYKPTIGTDFLSKEIKINDQTIKLQIWDTAGQETWSSQMGSAYYRGSDCCIFVYDLTNPATLQSINKWCDNFIACCGQNVPLVLVGNKADKTQTQVSDSLILSMQQTLKMKASFKCSAKSGDNVLKIFSNVAEICLENAKTEVKMEESFIVKPVNPAIQNPKKGCC